MFLLAQPWALWLLVPALSLWLLQLRARRNGRSLVTRSQLFFLAAGYLCLAIGLARPQIGREVSQRLALKGNVLLAIDISRSMVAQDTLPSRLVAATSFAEQFLRGIDGLKAAIFLFAQDGFFYTPLTSDLRAVSDLLTPLSPSLTTNQGTDMGATLRQLLEQLAKLEATARDRGEEWAPTQVVLLSDGETHEEIPSSVLSKFRERHIPVHTVLFGTTQGASITVSTEAGGNELLRFRSGGMKTVLTKANPKPMARIAAETRGLAIQGTLGNAPSLAAKVRDAAQLGRLRSSFRVDREFFPELLLLALLFFVAEIFLGRWSVALRRLKQSAAVAAIVLVFASSARAEEATNESPTRTYNEAVAALKSGDGKKAVEKFQRASQDAVDTRLRKRALFGLGNSMLRLGDPRQALDAYQQARDVKTGDGAFDQEANRRISDNISLAVKKEEEQKKQQQKQQQQNQSGQGDPNKPQDQKGPQNDYEAQKFSEEEKQRMYDLLASEEQQILQRSLEKRNRKANSEPPKKPW